MADALATEVNPDLAPFVHAVFSMHDPDVVADLLDGAGFDDVSASETSVPLDLPHPTDFLWQYVSLTPLGAFVEPAPETTKHDLERHVAEHSASFVVDGRMPVTQPMVVATARNR